MNNMKLYIKTIDGKENILPVNKIVIRKDGLQTFYPSEEMLLEDGWEIYEPIAEDPTDEEILKFEKEYFINKVIEYDASDEVNIFYVNDYPIWLDKATRAGLMLRFQAETARGIVETSLWYNDLEFKLPVESATQMLYEIELYASACYDNTHNHIAEIHKIDNLNDLMKYDYKTGYPEKLKF